MAFVIGHSSFVIGHSSLVGHWSFYLTPETRNLLHRFHAHGHNLLDEADDVHGVVIAVGVVGDAGTLVGADLVLVDDPVECGAVAELVVINVGGEAGKG